MNSTPHANRIHIAIFGKRNAGKSSLLNALTGQEVAIVSPVKGTTTDPVRKAMELLPLGPVLFIDTAGLDDEQELGQLRVQKSLQVLQSTDFALYVRDINEPEDEFYDLAKLNFKKFNVPYLTVINKIDTVSAESLEKMKEKEETAFFVSSTAGTHMADLKEELVKRIEDKKAEIPLVGDLLPYNSKVILVVPIDSEAPKGRIILPQVQLIRDCLDNGLKSYVVRDTELPSALADMPDVDLVVTDSQAFKKVNQIVPPQTKLTSFSILLSRVKGDISVFLAGIKAIANLPEGAKILMAESCTHNHTHEDIGRVKIPRGLNKFTGKKFTYEFTTGKDFPTDLQGYDLVIHCASCMLNRKSMESRIKICQENNVPITNYGMLLAHLTGILDRAVEILR